MTLIETTLMKPKKLCQTCGLELPENVTASHHPPECTCGMKICSAKAPTLQAGCIWMSVYKREAGKPFDPYAAQFAMALEREIAIVKAEGGPSHDSNRNHPNERPPQ